MDVNKADELAEKVYQELEADLINRQDGSVLFGLLEYLEKNHPKILRDMVCEE